MYIDEEKNEGLASVRIDDRREENRLEEMVKKKMDASGLLLKARPLWQYK